MVYVHERMEGRRCRHPHPHSFPTFRVWPCPLLQLYRISCSVHTHTLSINISLIYSPSWNPDKWICC
jgi:hypothetical protein